MATDPTGYLSIPPDLIRGTTWKTRVRVATTANGTLATAFANGQTVDGITLATGDRILLKNQTAGSANGIYTVNAAGAPTRAYDFDQDLTTAVPAEEVMGAIMYVIAGTANGGTLWRNTNTTAPTLGSTSLTFAAVSGGSSGTDLGWFNVKDYGALGNGTTDDTVAIQAAIDACATAGGGTIYFPAGIYQIDGALRDTATFNSQLEIPQRNVVRADGAIVIRFLGATPPYSNNEGTVASSVLRSSWNGTISGNPAIISGGLHDSLTLNWTIVHFENIEIRAHADPKLTAIDGTKLGGIRFQDLTVSVYHTNDFAIPLPADWTVPSHSNAIGVDFPRGYDDLDSGGDRLFVSGFYTGLRPGEQFTALGVWTGFCRQGVDFRGEVNTGGLLRHAAYIGRFETFFCPRGIVFSGDQRWVWIGMAGFEHEDSVAAGWSVVYDIDDASSYGRGHIGWHTTDWTTGPDDNLIVNGGTGLSLHGALAKRWRLANVVDIPIGTNPSTNPANGRRLYTDSSTGHLSSRDSSGTVYDYEAGSALTIKDEGGALATAATSIDFVGLGVVASGATAAKTVTITRWISMTAYDPTTGNWLPLVDGSGNQIIAEA